jgi:demethylmenaquinone methyltransferase/2-methoxy-6-polyprenyl-1,4-benzoquinol methylase
MTPSRTRSDDPEFRLGQLDVEEHLRDPTIKQRFVTTMFDVVAPRYDRFTRVFSFGMDRGWKRLLLQELENTIPADGVVLDLASGTGDLAFGAASRMTGGAVVGLDVSRRMLQLASRRRRLGRVEHVQFCYGSIAQLPYANATADAVTAGYALRNAPELHTALAEIARVLKPGGRVYALDFYRPAALVWRRLFVGYLRGAGNLVGWLWHREPVAYGYIAASIEHFVSWQSFSEVLEQQGLQVERVHRKLFGGIAIHVARKR